VLYVIVKALGLWSKNREYYKSIKKIKEESLSPLQKEELQKLKSLLPDNEDDNECSLLFVGKFKQ
jgi:hypothetical protein